MIRLPSVSKINSPEGVKTNVSIIICPQFIMGGLIPIGVNLVVSSHCPEMNLYCLRIVVAQKIKIEFLGIMDFNFNSMLESIIQINAGDDSITFEIYKDYRSGKENPFTGIYNAPYSSTEDQWECVFGIGAYMDTQEKIWMTKFWANYFSPFNFSPK